MTEYLFTYGPGMDHEFMARHIPNAEWIGAGLLVGYRMALQSALDRAVTNIVRAPGNMVWGVLYALPADNPDVLNTLDTLAMQNGRIRLRCTVSRQDGSKYQAYTYAGAQSSTGPLGLHSSDYERMLRGAENAGLPSRYINQISQYPILNAEDQVDDSDDL